MFLTFVKNMHRTFVTVLLLTACGLGVNAGEYYFRHLNQRYSELHTLLIVDDNEDLLDFMRNYLDKCYNIIMAHDGEEALGIAHSENVEIIISDVMMPKIDGVELCRMIKEDNATSHIPVILLTAKSETADMTGFSDYITFSKAFKKLIGVAPSFYTADGGEHTDAERENDDNEL